MLSRSTKLVVFSFIALALGRWGYLKVKDVAATAPAPPHTTAFGHEVLAALERGDKWHLLQGDDKCFGVWCNAGGKVLKVTLAQDWQGKSLGWKAHTAVALGGKEVEIFSDADLAQIAEKARALALRLREQRVAREQQELQQALEEIKEGKP